MKTTTPLLLQLGDPVEHRGVVIAPLFPRSDPRAEYLTLEQAVPLGFHVTEVDEAGSVPQLLATNPLDKNVLLYDGEELLGAKQNRILNVTVLVTAASELFGITLVSPRRILETEGKIVITLPGRRVEAMDLGDVLAAA